MKRLAGFFRLISFIAVFFFLPGITFAETDINIQSNTGDNTICQNGVCTTTSGSSDSHATACINGHCETSDTGNLHMHEGDDSVTDQSTTPGISVTVSPNPTETPTPSDTPEPTASVSPSMTPDPTIIQMRKDLNKHVKEDIEAVKEHIKAQNAALSSFLESLQNLLNGLFK